MNAKKRLIIFALFLAGMLGLGNMESLAATITSAQSGNWATTSTWVGGVVPTNADDVVIANGHTVTVNTAAVIQALSINGSGTLRPDASSARSIEMTGALTIADALTGSIQYSNGTGRLSFILNDATITYTSGGTDAQEQAAITFFNVTVQGTVTTSESFAVYGNFNVTGAGNYTASAGEVLFSNNVSRTLTNNGSLTLFNIELAAASQITSSSDVIIDNNWLINSTASWSVTGSAIVTHAGGQLDRNGTLTFAAGTGYNITDDLAILDDVTDFDGDMTLGTNITLTLTDKSISGAGTFTSNPGSVLSLANATGVNGAIDLSGTRTFDVATDYIFTTGTSILGFSGAGITTISDLTVNGVAAVVTTTDSFTMTGDLHVDDGSLTASSGTVTFTGTTALTVDAGETLVLSAVSVSATGAVTIAANSTLSINGDLAVAAAGSMTPASVANVAVTFGGTTTLTNLGTLTPAQWTITGTLTLGSDLTFADVGGAAGDLILNGASAVLDVAGNQIDVSGTTPLVTLTLGTFRTSNAGGVDGSFANHQANFLSADADVNYEFYGVVAQTTLGLTMSAAIAGDGTTTPDITSMTDLTITGGATAALSPAIATLGATSAGLTISGDLTLTGAAEFDVSGDVNDPGITFDATTTIAVASTATLIFEDLDVTTGTVTTASSMSIGAAGIFTVAGGGSFVASSGTFTFATDGGVDVDNSNVLTFNDVRFNHGTAALTPATGYSVAGNFWMTSAQNYAATAGTVTLTGTSKVIDKSGAGALTFFDLTVNGTYTTAHSFSIAGTTAGASLTVGAAGSLNASAGTITLSGAAGGISNAGGGSLSFFNLTHSANAAYTGASTLTIKNDFDIAGTTLTPNTSVITMSATDGGATISGTTINVNNLNLTASGSTYTLTAGDIISGAGTVAVSAGAAILLDGAGSIAGAGTLTMAAGSLIQIVGTGDVSLDATLTITTVTFANGVDIVISGIVTDSEIVDQAGIGTPRHLTITSSAMDELGGDLTISGNLEVSGAGSYIEATTGSRLTFSGTGVTIVNNGTLSLGELGVTGTATTASSFNIGNAGATAGVINVSGSLIASAGTITFGDATTGSIVNTGTLTFFNLATGAFNVDVTTASSFTIANNLTLGAVTSSLQATAGTITFSSTAGTGAITPLVNAASGTAGIEFFNVSITGVMADPSVVGAFIVNVAGTTFNVSSTGIFEALATSAINFTNAAGCTITNNGTLEFGDVNIAATVEVYTASDITIRRHLTLAAATSAFQATAGTVTFSGTGTITSTVNYATTPVGIQFNNFNVSGTMVQAGDFTINVIGNVEVLSGGSFIAGTGDFIMNGSSNKTITNAGTLTFMELKIANTTSNNVTSTSSFGIAGTAVTSFEIVGTTGGSFIATDGTITFSGANGGITNTSALIARCQFHGLAFTSGGAHTIATNNVIAASGPITFSQTGAFSHTAGATSRITLNGTAQQDITVANGTVSLGRVTLNNSNGARLVSSGTSITDNDFTVTTQFLLTSGDFDLNGDNVLTIAAAGKLQETAGNTVTNNGIPSSTGNVYYTENNGVALVNNDLGGLGARLTTTADPGATVVRRYHVARTNLGNTVGIARYYGITTANGSLNSKLIMKYDDTELGSNSEANLVILSSTDPANGPWLFRDGVLDANSVSGVGTITTQSIGQYTDTTEFWTIGVPTTITTTEITGTSKGISASPLTSFSDGHAIYGLKLVSNGTCEVTSLVFDFSRALGLTPEFSSLKLVKSLDNSYLTTNDNEDVAATQTGGVGSSTTVGFNTFTTAQTLANGQPAHYFLVVNVATGLSSATPAITPSLIGSNITVTDAVVKTYSEAGLAYSFLPGLRIEKVTNGLNQSPIIAGSTGNGILGFAIRGTSATNYTGFTLKFDRDISTNLIQPKVYISTDNDFSTTGNNTLITSTNTVAGDSITFVFTTSQGVLTSDKYYFVTVDAKGNVDGLTATFVPSLLHNRVTTTTAGYTYKESSSTDTSTAVTGDTYSFARSTVTVSTTDGTTDYDYLGAGITDQTVLGFTLTPDNGNTVAFTGLTAHAELGGNAGTDNFNQFRLWHDANNNGYAESGEQIATAEWFPTVSKGNLVFGTFSTAQSFSSARNYLITVSVLGSTIADSNGTLRCYIPDQDYIRMTAPVKVNAGGEFSGETLTVKHGGTATQLELVGNYLTNIATGDNVTVTAKAFDAQNYPTNVTGAETVTVNVSNDAGSSLGGTLTGTILAGKNRAVVSPTVNNATGSTTTQLSFTGSSLAASTTSNNITIRLAAPTTDGSAIVVAAGPTPQTQITVSNWTVGNGTGRIIVVREGRPPHAPTNGTVYVAETDLKEASISQNQTGPGSFVVYTGSGAAAGFTVTGLTPGRTYYFALYEFNGSLTNRSYKSLVPVTASNPVSFKTTSGSLGVISDSTSAANIATDVVVTSTIGSSSDNDWFQFIIPADRNNVMVQVYDLPKNYTVELWDRVLGLGSNMVLIRKSEVLSTGRETLILNNATAGKYLIKVYGADSDQFSSTEYKIKVTTSASRLLSQVE